MYEFDKCIIMHKETSKTAEGYINEYVPGTLKVIVKGDRGEMAAGGYAIYIYNNFKGECRFDGVLSDAVDNLLTFSDVKFIRSVQKRDNTRVNKQMKYRITSRYADGIKQKIDKPIDITILNISAEGLCFNTDRKLKVGCTFPLMLRETRVPIEVTVEVVREDVYAHSSNYGCRFINISEKEKDEIYRFVLKEQIDQRRHNIIK